MSSTSATLEPLDEAELSGEQAGMYVFQWLCETEKAISRVAMEDLKAGQSDLEKTLVKIIAAPAPFPLPGRPVRNVVARCFIALYRRVETRTLFDTLQGFLKIVGDFKTPTKDEIKIAALSVTGDLMAVYGSQFMSFVAEIITLTLKIAKSSSSCLLRYHALLALQKTVDTTRRAVTDSAARDIFKQMRNTLTDKALPAQRAAAAVLTVLYSNEGSNPPLNEIEAIIALCVKSLEHADQPTRRSHALLVAHILASTQVERVTSAPEPSNKKQKNNTEHDDGDDDPAPAATVAEISKPLLTPSEMLARISVHFVRPNTSRKTRIGIFDFYVALLQKLGPAFVEANYAAIVAHFVSDVITPQRHTTAAGSRYEGLLVRSLVGIVLRDLVASRMLSEQGQIGAIQELSRTYLRRWPAMMPGQTAPHSAVLVMALRAVAALLQQLGNAPPPVQDAVAEPLMTLLSHPSHSVRVTASWALRCFCYTTPLRLPKMILTAMEFLQRDLTSITSPAAPSDINLRTLGHAYGLSALIAVIPERPLYVSYDVSAKVLDMAIQLLKRAGDHDVKIAGVEVEVAWTLIAALMALGPNFVRPHLPQLLVLWRNALPKPTSKDAANSAGRSAAEWSFLLHVRESALGAIYCFLQHNAGALVTLDVARRVSSVLSNALNFANGFVGQNIEDPSEQDNGLGNGKGLGLRAREALLRRRVYQCFSALGFSSIAESTQTTLLQSTVSLFASPDGYAGSSVQAAIASSSGTFTSVWQSADEYAYGVTFKEVKDDASGTPDEESLQGKKDYLNRDSLEVAIDDLLHRPIIGACEHDILTLCMGKSTDTTYLTNEPPPPATSAVDTSIELFSRLLPLQDLPTTVRIVTELLEYARSPKLEKNAGRKAAVFINSAVAIVMTLRVITANSTRQTRDVWGSAQVTSLLSPFLKDALIDNDVVLRSCGSEAIGRLASVAGTTFLTNQIKQLVDQVVNNRDPYGRAGCALAFGSIYTHVGGLAAGPLLKTTVNVLMSLSNDSHPIVHYWSLNALARVINAASLGYAPFVSSTLGMLLKIYMMESHEREGGSINNANVSGEFPAYPFVCQIIDAIITILGPDIQESTRTRTLVLNLVHEFEQEEDEGIRVEAIACIQHFLMFAPEHVDIPVLVQQFRQYLSSTRRPLKLASINALYQLVQKDALAMSKLGGDKLVEDLFGMLDDDASVEGVRNVISSWLQQTVILNPSAWIDLCQRIMSKVTATQQSADAATGQTLRDDEGESLNVSSAPDAKAATASQHTSRWRTQLFALQCLHNICTVVARSGRQEHLNAVLARNRGLNMSNLLVSRVPDLIRMAFTASAAYVMDIRLEGLTVLRDVIQIFATSPDPAYEDALLLEQHQAPITAALTPAFSSDTTPEILASAVEACAVFVGCGVVKDVGRMGRILKLLTTALEQSKDPGMLSLGESGELSPNASAMLRIATVSAWAQLEVASVSQVYLKEVIKPYRATLASLWIASLRDYASIRVDSEALQDSSSVALDSSFSGLGKEVLLPYYAESWAIILQAVATAMQSGDPYILLAMDGAEPKTAEVDSIKLTSRSEPTMCFFIVFGLVYEALATTSGDTSNAAANRRTIVLACLQALKCLVRPEYAGKAILDPPIFEEFISLCYRIALTEPASMLVHLIELVKTLADTQEELSGSLDILSLTSPKAHCLRICSHILRHSIASARGSVIPGELGDRIRMITAAFAAFASIASSVKTTQREDVRAVAILLYNNLLKDELPDMDLVPPTLPALKTLLDVPPLPDQEGQERLSRTIHGLLSACLLNVEEMRGREGPAVTKKIKNNFLAAVLVLTVVPTSVKIGQPVVEHLCFLLTEKLVETSELSLTAAQCARTLIGAAASGNVLLRLCAKLLMPGLIEFVAKMAPAVNDRTISDLHSAAIAETWKAFNTFFTSVPDEHRTRLLGVLLPTIALLLLNAQSSPSPVTSQSVVQLLAFATTSQVAFKDAAAKLEPETRELLEQAVRRAVGGNSAAQAQASAKPQISLRSF
ncbi:ARM repeat-containing protein [Schizophyllum commune H4-8]|uniref:ARM repeat-containing protein n=1 Tax=Schizophyllum commune (strain H4-8 / FGSC 9210) TaxID=578458 RepID=UPI00215FB2EB|nr:ARM repeat-containing protein [Schizophyllum commune H4-8]KAI5895636.1 ARM repeat-containing protein [Schizophyllum commune H4-8]